LQRHSELTVTKTASERSKSFSLVRKILPIPQVFRSCSAGGCSGFQYSLNIEEESKSGDFIVEKHGIKLSLICISAQYLNGITIDYTSN
jgi:iron-sulfur cluster assembly accessory protein